MVFSGRLEPDSVFPASILKQAAIASSPPNKTWKNELIAYGQNSGSSVKLTDSREVNSTWMPDWVVALELPSDVYGRSVVVEVSLIGAAQWISFFSPCPRNHLQLKLVVNAPFKVFNFFITKISLVEKSHLLWNEIPKKKLFWKKQRKIGI